MPFDLSWQARLGLPFALPRRGGGTGRTDGMSAGFVFDAVVRADATAITRGQVVKRYNADDVSPSTTIAACAAATDRPYGIALADIALGNTGQICYAGAPVYCLTTGTIAPGDILYTSGTTGRLTPSITGGATPVAISLGAASGTSAVWAIVVLMSSVIAIDHGSLSGLGDDDHPQYLLESLLDAKGDLYVASANDTPGRLAVGANGRYLIADSTQTLGVRWGTEVVPSVHDESLTDGASNFIFAGGDIVTVVGVAN